MLPGISPAAAVSSTVTVGFFVRPNKSATMRGMRQIPPRAKVFGITFAIVNGIGFAVARTMVSQEHILLLIGTCVVVAMISAYLISRLAPAQ
jgi:UTP-glucose-1-phosphate uridylyltransferase